MRGMNYLMYDLLIKNAEIITVNPEKPLITNGFIGIKDGRLALVSDSLPENVQAREVIDGKTRLQCPGWSMRTATVP